MMMTTIITVTDITTIMTESGGEAALLRLMTWLSPAFPVGSFSYSHGLERVVHDGFVGDAAELQDWLEQLLELGSAWNDAVIFAESWRRAIDNGDLMGLAELAEALAGCEERHRETVLSGTAFIAAASAWPHPVRDRLPANCPYVVAVGAIAGAHAIGLRDALSAFLQAFASNLVQASIRLGVVGQKDAFAIVARLERPVIAATARAATSSLDDLGTATLLSDIAAMRHESQYSRLFRT